MAWKEQRGKLIQASVLGFNQVEFSHHALARMKQRKIRENQVLATIKNPDETGLPTQSDRHRVRKRFATRTIDVVYLLTEDRILVVTTYFRKN